MSKAKGEQFVALDMTARCCAQATETGMGTREPGVGDGRPYEGSSSGTDLCLTVAGIHRHHATRISEAHAYYRAALGPHRTPSLLVWYRVLVEAGGHVNRTLV